MRTFEDLVFEDKFKSRDLGLMGSFASSMASAKQARLTFDNGYSVSVITGYGAYGGEEGLYELAILTKDGLCYDTPITDDVMGHMTPQEVTIALKQVQELPND